MQEKIKDLLMELRLDDHYTIVLEGQVVHQTQPPLGKHAIILL
jgi:hypothetical protein